jgi:transcriptional regulator with XRE-family HTH domain
MAQNSRPDSPKAVGARLRLIRIAYGILQGRKGQMSQAEISRFLGIGRAAWNNAETGDNRLSVDNALKLRRKLGVSLDYLFDGEGWVRHDLMIEIAKLEASDVIRRA